MKQMKPQQEQHQRNDLFQQRPAKNMPTNAKRRFQWGIVWGVLLIVVVLYVIVNANSSIEWGTVMDRLGVRNRERYTALFRLGLLITACCAIGRILRDRHAR